MSFVRQVGPAAHRGMGMMIPVVAFIIETPRMLVDTRLFERAHNQVAKDAMRKVMLDHHQKRVPGHFKQTARNKYKHEERSPRYRAIKRRQTSSITDLVHSGRTKRHITQMLPKISVSGTGSGPYMRGRITFRFPFPVGRQSKPDVRVVPDKMAKEIATWTDEELRQAAQQFASSYLELLQEKIDSSPTLKKKLGNIDGPFLSIPNF